MTGPPRPLAEGFATPTREQWLAAVRAGLRGAPIESLTHHTVEDLAIAPLYGPEPGAVRRAPQSRAAPAHGWDVRALVAHPDPAEANRRILDALAGGATSILLKVDPSAGAGCAIASAEDLAHALHGVVLEAAALSLAIDIRWSPSIDTPRITASSDVAIGRPASVSALA